MMIPQFGAVDVRLDREIGLTMNLIEGLGRRRPRPFGPQSPLQLGHNVGIPKKPLDGTRLTLCNRLSVRPRAVGFVMSQSIDAV